MFRRCTYLLVVSILYFGYHLISGAIEILRCEQMLVLEDQHEQSDQYRSQHSTPYTVKEKCKIPGYGVTWVVTYEDDE